jgi:hypothetical protein
MIYYYIVDMVTDRILSSYPSISWDGDIYENGSLHNVRIFTKNAAEKAKLNLEERFKENQPLHFKIYECEKHIIPRHIEYRSL